MVVFNIIAVVELFVALGLYWLIALVAPGLESPDAIALGDVTTSGLVLSCVFFAITGLSEFVGLRGRLFWLPTHAFVGVWLGNQLSQRIGVAGWVVAGVLAAAVIGVSWWKNRDGGEVSEADAQRALTTADEAIARNDLPAAWEALQVAFLSQDEITPAGAMHNRAVLARIYQLTPPQHQAFVGNPIGVLDAAYGQIEGGQSPANVDLTQRWVVSAVLEKRGEIPPSAYQAAEALAQS